MTKPFKSINLRTSNKIPVLTHSKWAQEALINRDILFPNNTFTVLESQEEFDGVSRKFCKKLKKSSHLGKL